jgi:hypothetical protein
MAERFIGEKGSPKRRRFWFLPFLLVACTALFWIAGAQAVHDDGLFQLDRNALTSDPGDPPRTGDDWDRLDDGTGDPNNDDSANASTFVADGEGPTIFTGGGSKDDLDTTSWEHKTGSTPPKDELLDGFAARYGDILYFGADRTANNGDAVMGFWFFQNEVVPQDGGTFGPGQHEDGDVLILSDFTGGGSNVTIRVFQWNGPGGSIPGSGAINGTLDLIAGTLETPADCVGSPLPPDDPFCATVNNEQEIAPWTFDPKVGDPGFFQPGELYEGGIDLAFLDLEDECFASFLAETRASTSVDATLKDFVGGAFEPCESSVDTTPSNASGTPLTSIVLGGSIHDHALITGTGGSDAPTGTMSFFICSPSQLDAPDDGDPNTPDDDPATCDVGGTAVNGTPVPPALNPPVTVTPVAGTTTSTAISSAFTPNAIGTWCWRGVYSGDGNYPSSTDSSLGECFTVTDIASTTTAQKWLPNDTATVTAAGGSTVAGNVTFSLYESANCSGVAVATFGPIAVDANGVAVSNNTTYETTAKTISWRAVFTSTNNVASGPASHCETMTVSVLNNDIGS